MLRHKTYQNKDHEISFRTQLLLDSDPYYMQLVSLESVTIYLCIHYILCNFVNNLVLQNIVNIIIGYCEDCVTVSKKLVCFAGDRGHTGPKHISCTVLPTYGFNGDISVSLVSRFVFTWSDFGDWGGVTHPRTESSATSIAYTTGEEQNFIARVN